jgi:hypothetical protein
MLKTYKGTASEYRMLHYWVERQLGKPSKCERCGTTRAKRFDWANISHEYKKDIADWIRLCKSCHFTYDNDNKCRKGHELSAENIYVQPATGRRRCLKCKKDHHKIYVREWYIRQKNNKVNKS